MWPIGGIFLVVNQPIGGIFFLIMCGIRAHYTHEILRAVCHAHHFFLEEEIWLVGRLADEAKEKERTKEKERIIPRM